MIMLPAGMFIQSPGYILRIQKLKDPGMRVAQKTVHIIDALPAKPGGIRRAKTLFCPVCDAFGNDPPHAISKDYFSILVELIISQSLARLVLIHGLRILPQM